MSTKVLWFSRRQE